MRVCCTVGLTQGQVSETLAKITNVCVCFYAEREGEASKHWKVKRIAVVVVVVTDVVVVVSFSTCGESDVGTLDIVSTGEAVTV